MFIPVIGLFLFFAFTPDTQAQYYYGVGSTSVTTTYEDYDARGNLKLYKETTPMSAELVYDSTREYCWLEMFLDDNSIICIYDAALVNTDQLKPKNKNYKETYQVIGYGYKYDLVTEAENLVIMNATGTFTENQNGDVLTITISGTLSGGNSWGGMAGNSDEDYIWTAKFKSTLIPD